MKRSPRLRFFLLVGVHGFEPWARARGWKLISPPAKSPAPASTFKDRVEPYPDQLALALGGNTRAPALPGKRRPGL